MIRRAAAGVAATALTAAGFAGGVRYASQRLSGDHLEHFDVAGCWREYCDISLCITMNLTRRTLTCVLTTTNGTATGTATVAAGASALRGRRRQRGDIRTALLAILAEGPGHGST